MFITIAALCLAAAQDVSRPTEIQLRLGPASVQLYDPFGTSGSTAFHPLAYSVGGAVIGDWYILQGTSKLISADTKQRDSLASFHVSNSIKGIRVGMGIEYRETLYQHPVYSFDRGTLSTERRLRVGMGTIDIGPGDTNALNARLSLMAGWYANRYSSILALSSSRKVTPLAVDEPRITGIRPNGSNITGISISGSNLDVGRIRLHGSLEYLWLIRGHSAFIPSSQFTTRFGGLLRVWAPQRPRGLYVGLDGHFNEAVASLAPERSVQLYVLWRFR